MKEEPLNKVTKHILCLCLSDTLHNLCYQSICSPSILGIRNTAKSLVANVFELLPMVTCQLFVPVTAHASDLCDAGAGESHYDGHDVDSELELKELGDAVVDVTAPHYCFHDTAEVVISQNDI